MFSGRIGPSEGFNDFVTVPRRGVD